MYVHVGNPAPIEQVQMDGVIEYRRLKPFGVTTFHFPDDIDLDVAVFSVVDAMRFHMAPESKVPWIESDSLRLQKRLCSVMAVDSSARRPATWGYIVNSQGGESN